MKPDASVALWCKFPAEDTLTAGRLARPKAVGAPPRCLKHPSTRNELTQGLVDGVSGLPAATVDGLAFDRYVEPLRRIGACLSQT